MEEVFPVASGIVLGLALVYLVPGHLRTWILAAGSVLLGATASWLSGELAVSWLFLLVDISQLTASSPLSQLAVAPRSTLPAARIHVRRCPGTR